MADDRATKLCEELLKELSTLEQEKAVFNSHYEEIAELLWPQTKNTFFRGSANPAGEKKTDKQLDSTPEIALNQFGAILDSLLTPRNATWHRLRPSDASLLKSHRVRLWFDQLTRVLFEHRYSPRANFASQNQMVYKGLGAFGSGAMFIDPLRKFGPGLRYKAVHIGEMHWRENHQGVVDYIVRVFCLKAYQLVSREEWRDRLSDKVKNDAKVRPDKEYTIIHRVRPRDDHDPDAFDQRSLPFESVYVLKEEKTVLEEGGFRSMPYTPTRYDQAPGETYGRSPAMQALPAIKTLMVQKRTILTAGHRAVNPIILAADDGIIDNISMRPGHVIAGGVNADGRELVKPMVHGRVDIGKELMDDERAQINAAFLVHLFQILAETPRMTATEVLERTREKGILLAPTVGRQESEYLGPMIEREIDVLAQQNLIPPLPPELIEARGEYRIEYDNPLSRMARAEEAAGFNQTLQVILPVINITGDPSPLDNFDFDVITRDMADIQAVPARWMKPGEIVAGIRAQRQEQIAAQQQAEAAPGQAALLKAAADAKSKGLTERDIR